MKMNEGKESNFDGWRFKKDFFSQIRYLFIISIHK